MSSMSRLASPAEDNECLQMNVDDGMPSRETIIAAAALGDPPLPEPYVSPEHVEGLTDLVTLRAEMICTGCRCGWLCCECHLGCTSCKWRRRFCYCTWAPAAVPGGLSRIYCEICEDLFQSCRCRFSFRCKWCEVSLDKCKRGGCVTLLPSRNSPEALPFVDIFKREAMNDDEPEYPEEPVAFEHDFFDMRTFEVSMHGTPSDSSVMSLSSDSHDPMSSSSSWSIASTSQGDSWLSGRASDDSSVDGDGRYGSVMTLGSSSTSGGSYSSVGGKSNA